MYPSASDTELLQQVSLCHHL